MGDTILDVKDLHTYFYTENGTVRSVNGVSFHVNKGEVVGIVGESGSGKSVTSLSILQLVGKPGKIVNGKINFKNKDLTTLSEKEIRKIRGNEISMIFQEPLTSLNPVFTIGNQISEAIRQHHSIDKQKAKSMAIDMLKKVGIPNPEKSYYSFPHLMSGGMRQRVMIAMALSCNPELLIADEPTTALDVTIQAQILELIKDLQQRLGMSVLFITDRKSVV